MSQPSAPQAPMPIEVYNSIGGSAFFQRLLQEWGSAGAQVTHCQALSESAYRAKRGAIGRIAVRWQMYAGYSVKCWRQARRGRMQSSLRVVTTNPFFAPALVARATRGHGATINLVYDLFPEALTQAGRLSPDSWMAHRCADITRFALRECEATVFLGDRLRAYAEATYGPCRSSAVIPVGADGIPFKESPPQRLRPEVRPQILYSGQMGRMHETETLVKLWSDSGAVDIDWVFHASGAGYARLRRAVGPRTEVTWGGALPDDAWQRAMKASHVALVTIAPGAERVAMPSKTYSALVAGQAILAICSRNSDLADLVVRHDCGWVVEPGDVASLRSILATIADSPGEVWAKRSHSFEAGHRFYDTGVVAKAWLGLFAQLQAAARLEDRVD